MNFLTAVASATTKASTSAGGYDLVSILSMVIPLALMVVVFYFLLIRPEKKRSAQMKQMLDNIQVADEIVTTGGIIGRVISTKEDTVLMETGSDRTKIRILKSSVAENRTVHENLVSSVPVKKKKVKETKEDAPADNAESEENK